MQKIGQVPEITGFWPKEPDGGFWAVGGRPFAVFGKNFSPDPAKNRIGIRVFKDAPVMPPPASDLMAEIQPTAATAERLDAVAPPNLAKGKYLIWVYVEGAGASNLLAVGFSPAPGPPKPVPKITLVGEAYPCMRVQIYGGKFSPNTWVSWTVGGSQLARYINDTLVEATVPCGTPPGWTEMKVEVDGMSTDWMKVQVLTPKPLNLYWDDIDENGMAFNPLWGYQLTRPYHGPDYYPDIPTMMPKPSFGMAGGWMPWKGLTTQQTYTDYGWWGCGPHINWKIPVTYEGFLKWSSHSAPGTDDDYNFYLFTRRGGGATTHGDVRGGIMTEFDSDETIDHFHTPWWDEFHNAVDHNDAKAHSMVDQKYTIVSGVMGLDMVHDGYSEVHPVWAMAALVKNDPNDDMWAMFVRSWGNEGYCGTDQHCIVLPKEGDQHVYRFRLPWRPGAQSVTWSHGPKEFLGNVDWGLDITPIPNQGVIVSFYMPGHDKRPRINGSLHLQWIYPPNVAPLPYAFNMDTEFLASKGLAVKTPEEVKVFQDVLESVPTDQRVSFRQEIGGIMGQMKAPAAFDSVLSSAAAKVKMKQTASAAGTAVRLSLPNMIAVKDQVAVNLRQKVDGVWQRAKKQLKQGPIVQPTGQVPAGAPDIAGQWNSNIGAVYEIQQNGTQFTWSAPSLSQSGTGTISGNDVTMSGPGWTVKGSVTEADASGKPAKIVGENGVILFRETGGPAVPLKPQAQQPPALMPKAPPSGVFNIGGQWNSNIGAVYEIQQNGGQFTWSVPSLSQSGSGTISGTSVTMSGPGWTVKGSVTEADASGKATKIVGENGVILFR